MTAGREGGPQLRDPHLMHGPLLATLTHARLRLAQGDVSAAREILLALLASEPDNGEARCLLDGLAGRCEQPYDSPAEEAPLPPQAGNPRELARTFQALRGDLAATRARKIRRLRDWASRISGAGPARTAD